MPPPAVRASDAISIDSSIESVLVEMKQASSSIDYIVAHYQDIGPVGSKQQPTLTVLDSGSGGIAAIQKVVPDGDVAYALLKTAFTWETVGSVKADTMKSILIVWRPDSIPFKRQRIMSIATGQMKKLFAPFHTTIEVSEKEELNEKAIADLLETITMRSNNHIGNGPPPPLSQTKYKEKKATSFLPTGTGADTMGTAKGAEVVFVNELEHKAILNAVRKDDDPTTWMLVRYEGTKKIIFHARGQGDLEELKNSLCLDSVMYGFFRITETFDMSATVKFCFLAWQPEVGNLVQFDVYIELCFRIFLP